MLQSDGCRELNLQTQLLIVSGVGVVWLVSVEIWRCLFSNALLFRVDRVGERQCVQRREYGICVFFLTILYNFGEVCGCCLMIFLLPEPANTGSAGVCLHSC